MEVSLHFSSAGQSLGFLSLASLAMPGVRESEAKSSLVLIWPDTHTHVRTNRATDLWHNESLLLRAHHYIPSYYVVLYSLFNKILIPKTQFKEGMVSKMPIGKKMTKEICLMSQLFLWESSGIKWWENRASPVSQMFLVRKKILVIFHVCVLDEILKSEQLCTDLWSRRTKTNDLRSAMPTVCLYFYFS